MTTLFNEHQNQNSLRKYPFADNCTMLSTTGVTIASDFIIDAYLFPIDVDGEIFIYSIDTVARRINLAVTSAPTKIIGYAQITSGVTLLDVYENTVINRRMGVLVFGEAAQDYFTGPTLTFEPDSLTFSASACVQLNQPGVRGIVADNNLFTHKILLSGVDDCFVHTSIEDANQLLEFNFVGDVTTTPDTAASDCFTDPRTGQNLVPIRTIEVVVEDGSIFEVTKTSDNTMAVSLRGINLSDVCNAQTATSGTNPCTGAGGGGATVPSPPTGGGHSFTLVPNRGRIYINAPSIQPNTNVVGLTGNSEPTVPVIADFNLAANSDNYLSVELPTSMTGFSLKTLVIYLKGLTLFQ